jgi:CDP-glucose 4,6-dehydratase
MTSFRNPKPLFWSGRRVAVTGHSGFKGAWLTTWLQELGAEITGLSLGAPSSPCLSDELLDPALLAETGDIRDPVAVDRWLERSRPEIVFHLAAQSLVRPSYEDPVGTYAINVMGTVHLLDAARRCSSIRAIVVVTTDKCYENREWHWPYRENEAMGGRDPYSSSKGCAELVTAAYRSSYFAQEANSPRVATARAGNVIGGGDWSRNRLLPDAVRAFAEREMLEIRSPRATRPWQHVLEPLCGYLLIAEQLVGDGGEKFAEGWNFGPEERDCRSVAYVVDQFSALWGEGASWRVSADEHPHEATFLKVDASKAKALLEWHPRLDLDQTLEWSVSWYRSHQAGADARQLVLDQIHRYQSFAPVSRARGFPQ